MLSQAAGVLGAEWEEGLGTSLYSFPFFFFFCLNNRNVLFCSLEARVQNLFLLTVPPGPVHAPFPCVAHTIFLLCVFLAPSVHSPHHILIILKCMVQ